jgi:hypothetical protein
MRPQHQRRWHIFAMYLLLELLWQEALAFRVAAVTGATGYLGALLSRTLMEEVSGGFFTNVQDAKLVRCVTLIGRSPVL